jgi:PAS domain S-box-containing protein
MKTFVSSLLEISTSDPDDARRRKILNILLLGVEVLTLLIIVSLVVFSFLGYGDRIVNYIWWVAIGLLLGVAFLWKINRNPALPGWISSTMFLILLSAILPFTDTVVELAAGRSLFVFTIPVILSSMLLRPASSFIFAALVSVEISILAFIAEKLPNPFAIFSFFFLALISWLSSRSLEQALKDLRVINANLDRLVEEKTQELAQTLSRELILAGRNHAILNSIADGVIVFDAENRSILANPALSQLTNTSLDGLVNKGMMEFVQKEALAPSARGTLLGLFDHPEATPAGKRIVWGNKTLSASVARVQDDLGGNLGVVGVFRDVTREVELENMKNTFMAIVSHELRTPLNAILGFAEMLKEGVYGPANEKQQNISERIMNNTQRLLGIVSDLLDQAQIEAGRLKIQIAPCKPAEMLDALQGVMTKIAADKDLEFNTDLDPALPPVILGDPQRLQQVMVNLANNAIKFTEKGSVSVKLSRLDEMNWQIHVTDTGGGIPNEAREYIFETFRQVDGASTRQHGGVGLGLSIVKQLVELMKGKIVVESELGKGSTFIVTLPLLKHEGMSATTPR